MKMISRRDFMKASAVVGATGVLTACGGSSASSTSTASSAAASSAAGKGGKKFCIGMHHHKRWENEKTDSADDADVTWCKAGRYRNRCSKRRGRRCSD